MAKSTPELAAKAVPIAVVGVSALFPGSVSAGGFWRDILAGTDLMTDVPKSHWLIEDYYDPDPKKPDHTYAKRGAFIPDVDFDPLAWGIPPTIVPATDTSQLLALIVAQQVLQDAFQNQFETVSRERMSCILGVTSSQELLGSMVSRLQHPIWRRGLREAGLPEDEVNKAIERIAAQYTPWVESTFPGVLGNVVAGRIANRLDLGGTNCVTDAACASSFSALSMAVNELYLGQSDVVITGGVDTMNDIFMYMCFSKTPALSPSGDCRPFSDQADGTMLGEGLGMVALKRLSDAERDGDHVYAVIQAVGSSSDGRAKSVYAPIPKGQAKSIRRAYQRAGYGPETVELVEAHGTGTKAGDAAEFGGLEMAFGEIETTDRQWCALGSVKSQIGHTKAAAGAAGLFKAVMALHNRTLPPTMKIDKPNPLIDLPASPFDLNARAKPWIRGSDHPRRASVSSFGFGGTNFHIAMEEYTGTATHKAARHRVADTELVLVTGSDAANVAANARAMAGSCTLPGMLNFLAQTTQKGFDAAAPARIAVVAASEDELASKLNKAADLAAKGKAVTTPDGTSIGFGEHQGDVGFLFPGQGSQYLDMGSSAAIRYSGALAAWDLSADVDFDGEKLHRVVFPVQAFDDATRDAQTAKLTRTEWAQPAIGVTSLATLNLLSSVGLTPAAVGGHSYGEITALRAAGVLSDADFIAVSRKRGELMAEAASTTAGSMAAIVATREEVEAKLAEWKLDVVVANHNAPKQVVISGSTEAIADAEKRFLDAQMTAKRLNVATAFHSKIVADSSKPFGKFLDGVTFNKASVPVYSNAAAAPYGKTAKAMRKTLAEQIANPVRFVEQVQAMYDAGIRTFVEVGPNQVLTKLAGRILKGSDAIIIETDRYSRDGTTSLNIALGRLATAGLSLNLGALWDEYRDQLDPRDATKPKLVMKLNGANYGKPYPAPEGASANPGPNPPRKLPEPIVRTEVVEKIVEKIVEKEVPVYVNAPAGTAPSASHAPAAQQAAAPAAGGSLAWVAAYQQAQKQTADAHSAYQSAMAQSHSAFLSSVENQLIGLRALLTPGLSAPAMPAPSFAAPAPSFTAAPAWTPPTTPQPAATPAAAPAPALQPLVADATSMMKVTSPPSSSPVVTGAAVPVTRFQDLGAPVRAQASPAKPAPVAKAAPTVDLNSLMLTVVADKTGYPAEMLELGMDLEADLGVDSIKRVEILSAVREQAPGLPDFDANEMSALRTLGEIVDFMQAQLGPVAAAPVAAAGPAVDLNGLMLTVVADKTGYPAEMLELGMDLEADLGVDSIKRVEILSAVREQAPGLPDFDANEMSALRTLGEIVDFMQAQLGPVAAAPVASAGPAVDLNSLMLTVVADKTGYPAEMLELGMDLEADLGVDSIKRVEILSAVREQAPGLPDFDANEMSALRTLGEIVSFMQAQLGPVAAAPIAAAPVAVAGPAVDLNGIMLNVVADKTGYPADMLELHMDLEADLGVDSIKRVEILSAVREQAPGLPDFDANEMSALRTLGEIVSFMQAQLGPVAAAPAASAGPAVDLNGIMLNVVADKTGYPADMLELHMDLEADLGVDSIKRVEILSAVREQAPGLPDFDANEMSALRTLGEIVSFMQAQLGPVAAPPVAAAPVAAVGPAVDLNGIMLNVVADKTGYPAEMLELHMDLEADLGVDSIKRVEILSAVREQAPGLPDFDANEMSALRTLGEIVSFMQAQLGGAPTPVASAAPTAAVPALGRFPVVLVAAPPAGFALAGLLDAEKLVVTDDGTGVAPALIEALAAEGITATIVTTVPSDADGLIVLDGLAADDAKGANRRAFLAAKAVADHMTRNGGAFVTVQDTGGDFGISGSERAIFGGLAGLAKTARQEWAKAHVRAIDVERSKRDAPALARAIVAELLHGGTETEVGLKANGKRYTLATPRTAASEGKAMLGANDVVVASGGARGVTATTLIALAERTKAKFVLLGRSPLAEEPAAAAGIADDAGLKKALLADAMKRGEKVSPVELGKQVSKLQRAREVRGTLAAIDKAGGTARYVVADVSNADTVEVALETARAELGPITAIVHGAGVLADKLIADKTADQFDFVFDTKVDGLNVLLAATKNDPLKALVTFSSVAARCGNQGQVDYAMANEVLNKVASREKARRGDGFVAKSLGWGPWEGGMVTPALKKRFEALGVALIPLEVGAQMLVSELLDSNQQQVEIVLGGEPKAEALLSDGAAPTATYDVLVKAQSHPYLDSHQVKGVPVLPVALVLEWFAQAAVAAKPGLGLARLEDVKVLSGIKLGEFSDGGDRFRIVATQLSNGNGAIFKLELTGLDSGRKHYSATAVLAVNAPSAGPVKAIAGLSDWSGPVYGGVLFHGPDFQVIQGLEGVGKSGIAGSLRGLKALGWRGDFATDPALVDGGLQLALLWTKHTTGGDSLPTGVGQFVRYQHGPAGGDVRVVLSGQSSTKDKTTSDISFVSDDGTVFAELVGVQTHVLPGTASA